MNAENTVYAYRDVLHRPVSIRGLEGSVVVTCESDAEDHILAAGDRLAIRPRGLLAIRSLGSGARAAMYGGKAGREGRTVEFGAE